MMLCLECGALFEQAKRVIERHGLDTPPYEEYYVCPHCGDTNYQQTWRCDICGEWITGSYIKTLNGNRICESCYTHYEVQDG